MVGLPGEEAAMTVIVTTHSIEEDPDDSRVQVCLNGEPVGEALWPSEAAIVVGWLESIEDLTWTIVRKAE